ncbi:MAG TPA: DNA polymerase IV [Syntrophorhabdaceae bacterium]
MRIVGHLDMDAFFAAVEERGNPDWRGKPIVVGADPLEGKGRGVVSTANYKAREYGIHSALPISWAWRYSEEARKKGLEPAIFLSVNFKRYSAASKKIMEIVSRYSGLVEQASIDEAYFDLSFAGSYEAAEKICRAIKEEIRATGLTASVGIGPNKLIAKIASDREKPDGLTVVREDEAEAFLEPLPIRKIPGIGPKAEEKFARLRVKTVADLRKLTIADLERLMGKWGADLYRKVRALDDTPLGELSETKSIGEQDTFLHDTLDATTILEKLVGLCRSVFSTVAADGFTSFRTVVITVRFADFETRTRSHTFPEPVTREQRLEFEAMKLLMPFIDGRENPGRKPIRLIGVRVEKLAAPGV